MRYAVVSDIHSNLQAWEAVVADMAGLGVDHIICLGDLVGYGPNPAEVLAAVRDYAVVTVLGNHDAAACGRMDASVFNENAREAIDWTVGQLSGGDRDYLKELPIKVRPEGADMLVVHAEAVDPMAFGYILDQEDAAASFLSCEDRIIFIGHTHQAGVFMMQPTGEVSVHLPEDFTCAPGNRYIINPGSVGDPRSTEIVASYAIYDSESEAVNFRKVEFDIDSYRQSIDSTALSTRPFFIRYLDEVASSPATRQLAIPSVAETDSTPGFQLTALDVKIKKKDPVVKVGVGVLVCALLAGVWFFVSNSKSDPPSQIADMEKDSEISSEPILPTKKVASEPPNMVNVFPVMARYVRISLPRKGLLSLAEVEVYIKKKNVALEGKATQSSNHCDFGTADKAIDGNQSPKYGDRHMTHTKEARDNWWMVDLGKEYAIDAVVIWNRDEGATKRGRERLRNRLHGFTLEMLDGEKRCVFLQKKNDGRSRRIVLK